MADQNHRANRLRPIDTNVEWKLLYLPKPLSGNGQRPTETALGGKAQDVPDPKPVEETVGQS